MTTCIQHINVVRILQLPGECRPTQPDVGHPVHHHHNGLVRASPGVVIMYPDAVGVRKTIRPPVGYTRRLGG